MTARDAQPSLRGHQGVNPASAGWTRRHHRRPGEPHIIRNGGNTRLAILPRRRALPHPRLFRPWPQVARW